LASAKSGSAHTARFPVGGVPGDRARGAQAPNGRCS
jgi:hypothetical protein